MKLKAATYICSLIMFCCSATYAFDDEYSHRYGEADKQVILKAAWEEIRDTKFGKQVEELYNRARRYGRVRIIDESSDISLDFKETESLETKINDDKEPKNARDRLYLDILDTRPALGFYTPLLEGELETRPFENSIEAEFKSNKLEELTGVQIKTYGQYDDDEFRTGISVTFEF